MSKFKNVPIKYTSRDFNSIKRDLIDYTKRYYPNTYKDFSQAGFGSLMLDMVSYVGDIMSFYLDYQANESFLDTALEYDNVIKHGKQMGYKFMTNPSSHGTLSFFILVPTSDVFVGPNTSYMPILKRDSTFSSDDGNIFTLVEDVDFAKSLNEAIVATVDASTGAPLTYAIKAEGTVISGELFEQTTTIGDFQKFLKVPLEDENITEIVSVFDTEGYQYYEVDYLSQNIIYRALRNEDASTRGNPPSLLKPFVAIRRFVMDSDLEGIFLQFGHGSEDQAGHGGVLEPSQVVLDLNGRNYVSDASFDPNKLLQSDKLGISPSNTTLIITYRKNTSDSVNAAADTVVNANDAEFFFKNSETLSSTSMADTMVSLECTNPQSIIGDVSFPEAEEVKIRIMDAYASQNRAVTADDYRSLVYQMPSKYGAIKRIKVMRDPNSIYRNINLYVISEDEEGFLTQANSIIKQNVKTWLLQKKMISDTIDILDGKIINFGINFTVIGEKTLNRFDILQNAIQALINKYSEKTMDMGEPFFLSDVYNVLNELEGVVDTIAVEIVPKMGGVYSDVSYDFVKNMSSDGRYLKTPVNAILELKYPTMDIKGVIR